MKLKLLSNRLFCWMSPNLSKTPRTPSELKTRIEQLDREEHGRFMERALLLRDLHGSDRAGFEELIERDIVGRRHAYQLLQIADTFGDGKVPFERLETIGVTKLIILNDEHVPPEEIERRLCDAEKMTVTRLKAELRSPGSKPPNKVVKLDFTDEQYEIYRAAMLRFKASEHGRGFKGQEAALIEIIKAAMVVST